MVISVATSEPGQAISAAATVKALAQEAGFPLVGIAPAVPSAYQQEYRAWLELGRHGTMDYLARNIDLRCDPALLVPGARSIIALGLPYKTHAGETPPVASGLGVVSNYAWGDDYHGIIRGKLRELWRLTEATFPGIEGRTFVDTAPILEREVAARAGIGWVGKNTLLIDRHYGSYVFLAEVITTLDLQPDLPAIDHCGTCTRCLDACPTDAFPSPYVLDASRCISYLTIEHRGPIADEFIAPIGNLVYGCDICQQVCPWNAKAPSTPDPALQPRPQHNPLDLIALATIDETEYAALTQSSAMKRPKRNGLRRNATVALGNALAAGGDPEIRSTLEALSDDPDPVVNSAARQAVDRVR